ncbi:hypothetical protein LINPERPRIM_LOCUS24955 [Linum perenne]
MWWWLTATVIAPAQHRRGHRFTILAMIK